MDRGVIIGGTLICASFLLAVALNHSDVKPTSPAKRHEPIPELSTGAAPDLPQGCAAAVPDPSSDAVEQTRMPCD